MTDDRLDSWKEIATFLGRGITTVQRWEETEGLPVRRHAHAKRGSVYASRAELAEWRDRRASMPVAAAVARPAPHVQGAHVASVAVVTLSLIAIAIAGRLFRSPR